MTTKSKHPTHPSKISKFKKTLKNKRVISKILCIILILAMVIPLLSSIVASADDIRVVTLGADLSDEQRQLILNYFSVTENEAEIITVTNEDEHFYLDNIATQQQIGRHTYSCSYIEPTMSGGINIKTVNLNWVTCDMLRNALITSGITNCNIVCAAPMEVSGTGALTGVFKAYNSISSVQDLSDDKVELASEELIMTMSIAEDIGQDEASDMISDLKEQVITGEFSSEDDIKQYIDEYVEENDIEITEEQIWNIVEFMLKISKQDYDIEQIKQAYSDVKDTLTEIKENTEKTKNVLEKIVDFFKTLWAKITGTYEEIKESDKYQEAVDTIGIIANTKDELLGDNTIVTVTDEAAQVQEAVESNQNDSGTSDTSESDDTNIGDSNNDSNGILDKIKRVFKNIFNKEENTSEKEKSSQENSDNEVSDTSKESPEDTSSIDTGTLNFDTIQEFNEAETESETDTGMLQYITYELQNGTEAEIQETNDNPIGTPSLDDLTN
jgi:uncharacterized protein YpuA (DUF1002 family)